ncbi:MAG: hypothetical protein E7342_02785 [Clostridiales bacterium]|nr:hypothetical protein [Clostridiales bacterium]
MRNKVCPKCNTTLYEFVETGMLGCPFCYQVFANEVNEMILKVQGKNLHVGKEIKRGVDEELLAEYDRLLKEKEKAGLESRFSEMVLINSELEILKEELERRGLR